MPAFLLHHPDRPCAGVKLCNLEMNVNEQDIKRRSSLPAFLSSSSTLHESLFHVLLARPVRTQCRLLCISWWVVRDFFRACFATPAACLACCCAYSTAAGLFCVELFTPLQRFGGALADGRLCLPSARLPLLSFFMLCFVFVRLLDSWPCYVRSSVHNWPARWNAYLQPTELVVYHVRMRAVYLHSIC